MILPLPRAHPGKLTGSDGGTHKNASVSRRSGEGEQGELSLLFSLLHPRGGWESSGEPTVAWLELFYNRSKDLYNRV